MSKNTNPNASTTIQKFTSQIRINFVEGLGGGNPRVEVDAMETITTAGAPAATIPLGCVYQAPLATCFSGPSTAALATALNVTPAALKTALVAWFDGLVTEALTQ